MRTRLAATALSTSLLALGLAGCGDDGEAAADNGEFPSADESASASESPSGGKLDAEAAAFLDRLKAGMGEKGTVHVEMTMTGPVESTASGDTAYGPDGSEMRLTMEMSNMPGGAMEMVLVDGKAYMSMPGATRPGQFFEVDESNPAFAGLDDGLSPADSFAAFEAGLESVEEVGEEEIGGDATTHYRLEVDAEKALDATGQATVPGLPETLEYDVWLDAEDRMRRLTYELTGTELTMDMTEWGEPVTIEAPAKKDLVDAPPMVG